MIDAKSLFSALSNESRLRVLTLLFFEGELCVCDLTQALEFSQPVASRNLSDLRKLSLVSDRREGKWIYYRINKNLPEWILDILKITVEANRSKKPFMNDIKVMADIKNINKKRC